jgi:hypothetical protein
MKASFILILFGSLSACLMADESNPFTPQSLQLDQSAPTPAPAPFLGEPLPFRLDLPIGPVRIDYGIPLQKDEFRSRGGAGNWGLLA